MVSSLRWIGPSLVPALLLLAVIYFSDRRREPLWLVLLTFTLGVAGKVGTVWLEQRAAAWTGLDMNARVAGAAGSMLFLFGFAAPIREAVKVCAMWPAFRSKYFDEPIDGLVYSASAALGFALVESAHMLRVHPSGGIWIVRALLALPAHVFFACAWGYALGRAKRDKTPGPIFPLAWLVATAVHGLYIHLCYGRGAGALVGTVPLLLAMGIPVIFALRDLRAREDRSSRTSMLLERVSHLHIVSAPPSLRTVREAMHREGQPITLRWIFVGVFVTVGAMTLGLAGSIAFGHWAHVDFSVVDEHEISTTAPVALLGSGVLLAFPISGYLVARASNLPTMLEPAVAAALAIVLALALLGLAAPVALVFALAFSPIAWGLACAGAWIGRPARDA
ncbi:MAG: PrsW family intramembrane metalloprotease [Labilithrix sp.]|nr:PrsW family intramembrane metalloprotease [Labilithrix sp.]MCW5809490.1 PrsW family intramembrane metalloprotease [Labilithrix sp.]